jgi:hypothetical protein
MKQKDKINKAIIEAMTDDELFKAIGMIKDELAFRQTDFLTIPHYNGGIGTDARTPQH